MQPATRWVFAPSFEPVADKACIERMAPHAIRPPAQDPALLGLLRSDLQRGHHHVALRHFLMLKMSGHDVPDAMEHRCRTLFQACPVERRSKIARDVEQWMQMVGSARQQLALPP